MRTLLLFLVACTATSSPPTPDAQLEMQACHREPEHDAACAPGFVAMSCFTGSACTFDPGAVPRVCCP